MNEYMEMLKLPLTVVLIIVAILVIATIIKSIKDIEEGIEPGIIRIKNAKKQRKVEKQTILDTAIKIDSLIESVSSLTDTINTIQQTTQQNSSDILKMRLDMFRTDFMEFASACTSPNRTYSREMWTKYEKLYQEYEELLEKNGLTNGEMELSHKIFMSEYEKALRNNDFLENRYQGDPS